MALVFASLLLFAPANIAGGDPHYSFDDYTNTLPLPNGPVTNGTTMLVLPAKLKWTILMSSPRPTEFAPPEVLVAATEVQYPLWCLSTLLL